MSPLVGFGWLFAMVGCQHKPLEDEYARQMMMPWSVNNIEYVRLFGVEYSPGAGFERALTDKSEVGAWLQAFQRAHGTNSSVRGDTPLDTGEGEIIEFHFREQTKQPTIAFAIPKQIVLTYYGPEVLALHEKYFKITELGVKQGLK